MYTYTGIQYLLRVFTHGASGAPYPVKPYHERTMIRKIFTPGLMKPMLLATLFAVTWMSISACGKEKSLTPGTSHNGDTTVTPGSGADTASSPANGNFEQQAIGISVKTIGRTASGISKSYVLYTPATYNTEKTKSWPVIIFLHGIGERGSNINNVKNVGLPKKLAGDKTFQFVMAAPQCNADTWWDISSLNALYAEVIEKYNVDPKRVYITGLSMGGYGTWNWAMKATDKFAAVVPVCGGADYPELVCNLVNKPVWVFHNANDPTVGVENSRNLVAALKKCGNTKVKYTENATGGHDAWTKAYNTPELYTWLLQYKLQ